MSGLLPQISGKSLARQAVAPAQRDLLVRLSDEAPCLAAYKVVGVSLDKKINYVYLQRFAVHEG